jgi:4-alpha-glucanotransferase
MSFPTFDSPLTGTAVPLSALRSHLDSGIGEFPDLVALGAWCRDAGLSLIQLLPINDTGYESSPYSALSAFALHPVYLRLADLPGYAAIAEKGRSLTAELNGRVLVSHERVWGAKQALLRQLFDTIAFTAADAEAWLAAHSWGRAYAVFWALRERYGRAGWQSWPDHRRVDAAQLGALWNELGADARFPVWLQVQAEAQLSAAVKALGSLGVALKGDIPILLNEDSADVWYNHEYFDLSMRAGAPPDGMNPEGQNWGFPVYRWDALERDGYQWWKDRLRHAAQFYQAYRIDHVLGFFRLWATPQENHTAQLGHYQPVSRISEASLRDLGFDDGRLTWLSEPHIFGLELREHLGKEADKAAELVLARVGQEDLFRFKPSVKGEKDLTSLAVSDQAKGNLVQWFRNRALLLQRDGSYLATAQYYSSRAFNSLASDERWAFEHLIQETYDGAQLEWERQGRRLLSFMKDATSMLVCAEDLGSIPDCVPKVLGELGILGLKICRWARNWNAPGQPYYRVAEYPVLSVCTPSVHDTSTLRQWWDEETDHRGFLTAIGLEDQEGLYTPELARRVVAGLLTARSRLCILALQDWFAVEADLRTDDPAAERVNTPGTVGGSNWGWRMKPFLEDLKTHPTFTARVRGLADQRSRK